MDKLPQIHQSHIQERTSFQELEAVLPKNLFLLRSEDGRDYGVDRILEVVDDGSVTNIRSHLQMKSKRNVRKSTSGLSYAVPLGTLNYLLNSLNSLFLVFAENEKIFYWEWAGTIAQTCRSQKPKTGNDNRKTFSYHFTEKLGNKEILNIHKRLLRDGTLVKRLNLEANPFNRILVTDYIHNSTYRDYLTMFVDGKFEKIIALAKESQEFSSALSSLVALCYYNIYNYDEALKYIIKAEAEEWNPEFKKIHVAILCEKGIREENKITLLQAKELFHEIESSNWSWMDLYNYGNVLSALDELDEAALSYRRALKLEPKEAMIWKNLSDIYRKREDHEQELECLNKALALNPILIEALICKGILLGKHLLDYEQALALLEKALEISKSTFLSSKLIYYWVGEFYKCLRNYKQALQKIEEGLTLYPGDSYLENLRLRTLLVASESNPEYEKPAIRLLEEIVSRYPGDTRIRVEQLKVLSRSKSIVELLPIIVEIFATQNYQVEPQAVLGLNIHELIFILENLDALHRFRKISNFCQLLFERYSVSIAKAQKIEMKVNFLFSSLNAKIHAARPQDLLPLLQSHASSFVYLCEYCTEVLITVTETDSVEDKAAAVTVMITTLPEVLLAEFSRQSGWLIQQYNYPAELMDQLIESTDTIREWFNNCAEPILKGANNVLKWTREKDGN
ncbi:MAG: DUF4365 domain-containing protein [Syntrophales bacterium]|jgi:tetratricopeptide (TPR) repeat protein